MAQVRTTFTSDDRDIQKTLEQMHRGMVKLKEDNRQLAAASRKGTQDAARGYAKVGQSIKGVALRIAGPAGIIAGLAAWSRANARVIREAEDIGRKYDEVSRKFQVQSGLAGGKLQEANQQIARIGAGRGFQPEVAAKIATQLVSSGATPEQASGPLLNEFLKQLNAGNAAGRDVNPQELAKAAVSFLNSQDLAVDANNLARVGRPTQRLFRAKNIQVADLAELSKEAASLKGALTIDEQLATFAELTQTQPAAKAAVGLRNFVGRLQTAGAQEGKVKALERLGLRPEDVDFVGENQGQILKRLSTGLEKIPEGQRKAALSKIFGEEGTAIASTLIGGRKNVAEAVATARNVKGFDQDLAVAEGGLAFAERKIDAQAEVRRIRENEGGAIVRKAIQADLDRVGAAPILRELSGTLFDVSRSFGASPETAGRISVFGASGYVEPAISNAAQLVNPPRPPEEKIEVLRGDEIEQRARKQEQLQQENNQLMQDQNKLLQGIQSGIQQNQRVAAAAGGLNRHNE